MRTKLWLVHVSLSTVCQVLTWVQITKIGREDAIAALKQSVNLDNPSDWQLLIELTNQKGAE